MKKKILSLALALVLCLGLVTPALALNWSYGMMDSAGNAITGTDYQGFSYFSEGLIAVKKDGKWGFMDESGAMVIQPAYDMVNDFWGGLAAVANGEWLTDPYGGSHFTGKWGFIDKTGKTVIEMKYDTVDEALLGTDKDTWITIVGNIAGQDEWGIYNYGLIDKTGKVLLPLEYSYVRNIAGEADLLEISKGTDYDNRKCGVADFTGKVVIPMAYDGISTLDYNDNSLLRAYVRDEDYNSTYTLFDAAGKKLIDGYSSIEKLTDTLVKVTTAGDWSERKQGVFDLTGKVVLPAVYESIYPSGDGKFLQVEQGDYPNRTYSVLDLTGKEIISTSSDTLTISGGVIAVYNDAAKSYDVFDAAGSKLFTLDNVQSPYNLGRFSEDGLAPYAPDGDKCGFIDKTGTLVIPAEYSRSAYYYSDYDFSGGLIRVEKDGKEGVIDKTGKTVLPLEYDSIQLGGRGNDIPEGFITAGDYSHTGLYAADGTMIVAPEYSSFYFIPGSDGEYVAIQASRYVDGKYMGSLFTLTGKPLLSRQYDNAYISDDMILFSMYVEGFDRYGEPKRLFGACSLDGTEVIPVEYDSIDIYDNIIYAEKDGLYGAFDRTGKTVLPVKYDSVSMSNENCFFTAGNYTKASNGAPVSPWAIEEVNAAIEAGLFTDNLEYNLYDDSRLDLATNINRWQFASIAVALYEAMAGQTAEVGENPFEDVWDETDILKAYHLGLINGTSQTTFDPYQLVTREQAATILARLYVKLGGTVPSASNTSFADDASVSGWAKDAVAFMSQNGILKGQDNNMFNPQGQSSGEQSLIIALRMLRNLK